MRWGKGLHGFLLIGLLAGCSTGPVNVSDAQILNAKANHTPVIIYGTSFNDANNQGDISGLSVQFLVTSDEGIENIILFVRACKGASGQESGPIAPLPLNGPFEANTAYLVNPRFPFGENQQWQSRRSWHLVIKGIEVVYTNGTKYINTKNLSDMLTKKVANYCSTILYPNHMGNSIFN